MQSKNRLNDQSDPEKLRTFIDWCMQNRCEEVILRLSSEEKGGWSKNYFLDFTTSRLIITKKSFLKKFADLGYVAGLAPHSYLVLRKDTNSPSPHTRATTPSPEKLLEGQGFYIWYSDISEFVFRKGIETIVANMFGRAIVSNFLHISLSSGKEYDFTLPVNKNGAYEQIRYWVGVLLPSFCPPS
jgi:secreted Zn-dependent insulinase-like peptidase